MTRHAGADRGLADAPPLRVRLGNANDVRAGGDYVLYWMIAARRPAWSHALDRAVAWSRQLEIPLLVFEALRSGHRWASARTHRFVLDGMADNQRAFAKAGVRYVPYVEPEHGAGSGLLEALAARAAVVVTDEFPCYFLPRMVAAAAARIPVRVEVVDGNGLLPLAAAERAFDTAHAFRRHLQKTLPAHLGDLPSEGPLGELGKAAAAEVSPEVLRRWPGAAQALLEGDAAALAALPIDHAVAPIDIRGGFTAARRSLDTFLEEKLGRYGSGRNDPSNDRSSGLSPYLHFGHLAVHEVFARVAAREEWSPLRIAQKASGSRAGWWGMSESAESFLDELITWRELGYNFAVQRDDYDQYESLPGWAKATLQAHARDPRPHVYSLAQLRDAQTHDLLWNAAQTQLLREGRIHNYMRMLWGKKILEWSESPRAALEALIELNNRFAIDGRNPNSYTGIFWCLGRHDRPWFPERSIFGTVRYMSSENTARKLDVKGYLSRYGSSAAAGTTKSLFPAS